MFLYNFVCSSFCRFPPSFYHCPGKNTFCHGKNPTLSLNILIAATALDPRFKNLKCINRESREDVWALIRSEVEQYCKILSLKTIWLWTPVLTVNCRSTEKTESHDPLLWWKVNACRFPKLASFCSNRIMHTSHICSMRKTLQHTTLYCEWTKLRASLSPNSVKKLVCLKEWAKTMDWVTELTELNNNCDFH